MIEVNLLPWRENFRKKQREKIIFLYSTSLVMFCCLFFMVRFYLLHQLDHYKKINSDHALQNTVLQSSQEQPEKILLREARLKHQQFVFHLLGLFGTLHETIYLSEIICKGKVMQIKGEANFFSDIKQFMNELLTVQQVDFVKLATLKSSSKGLQFQLQVVEQ